MKIIIGGAGAVGTHLSKLLSKDHQDCVLIDENIDRLTGLESRYDIMTLHGSPTSIQTLKDAGVEHADLFVGVTPDESVNMNACMIAHALGAKKTVARIDNYEYLAPNLKAFFEQMGINSLIYPEVLAAIDITNGLKMSWVRQRWDVHGGALIMLGIKLRETCEILARPARFSTNHYAHSVVQTTPTISLLSSEVTRRSFLVVMTNYVSTTSLTS